GTFKWRSSNSLRLALNSPVALCTNAPMRPAGLPLRSTSSCNRPSAPAGPGAVAAARTIIATTPVLQMLPRGLNHGLRIERTFLRLSADRDLAAGLEPKPWLG